MWIKMTASIFVLLFAISLVSTQIPRRIDVNNVADVDDDDDDDDMGGRDEPTRYCRVGKGSNAPSKDCGVRNLGCFILLTCPDKVIHRGCGLDGPGRLKLPEDCNHILQMESVLREKVGFGCRCHGDECNDPIPKEVQEDNCSPIGNPFPPCPFSESKAEKWRTYCSTASRFSEAYTFSLISVVFAPWFMPTVN